MREKTERTLIYIMYLLFLALLLPALLVGFTTLSNVFLYPLDWSMQFRYLYFMWVLASFILAGVAYYD